MTFDQWANSVPAEIRSDSAWKMEAYRLSLFLSDLAWMDGLKLLRKRATLEMGDQLIRATSRISACIVEGYSRSTGKERARFYEFALGSTREARDWYYKARHVLANAVTEHRLNLATQVVKLLIIMSERERRENHRISRSDVPHEDLSSTIHQSPDGLRV